MTFWACLFLTIGVVYLTGQLIRLVDFIDQPSARSRRSARSCAPASRTASWRQSPSHTTRSRAARRAA